MRGDDFKSSAIGATGLMSSSRLRALLQAALESPADDERPEESAAAASRLLAALGQRVGLPGEGLFEEAMAPATTVPDLARIKEAAKLLLAKAERRDDREAAFLLYLLAVATALAQYGIEISSSPPEEQRARYESLATRHAGFALGDVFRSAADRLRKGT
jgi:hypothetical protein